MDLKGEQDKRQIEEYKKHPMINFADSINRSMIGDLGALSKGGCLTKVIITVIIRGFHVKRGILDFVLVVTYGILLYLGLLYQEHLHELTPMIYNPYPYLLFTVFFPMFFGISLAIPYLHKTIKGEGKLIIDKYRLVFMGIPTFYAGMMPLLRFSPIGLYLPFCEIISHSYILPFSAGTAFGYIVITSLKKC